MERDHPRLPLITAEGYLRSNLIITTTGVCRDSALRRTITEMGEDGARFPVDDPYEEAERAAHSIEGTTVITGRAQRD